MLWCSKCSKVLWATVFLEVVSEFTGRRGEFEHEKKLQCLTVKPFVSVFCCLCFLSIMNVESLEEGSHWLYIYIYIYLYQKYKYLLTWTSTNISGKVHTLDSIQHFRGSTVTVTTRTRWRIQVNATSMLFQPTKSSATRGTWLCMQCVHGPLTLLPPQRVIFMSKERYHTHPTPPQPHPIPWLALHRPCVQVQGTWCCVAPTMCASARNVTIPTPPHPNPTPSHDLRSTDHVCQCKEHDVA